MATRESKPPFVKLRSRIRLDQQRVPQDIIDQSPGWNNHCPVVSEITNWLLRAKTATQEGLFAERYHLQDGWSSGSVADSAALISTLVNLYRRHREERFLTDAIAVSELTSRKLGKTAHSGPKTISEAKLMSAAWLTLGRLKLNYVDRSFDHRQEAIQIARRLLDLLSSNASIRTLPLYLGSLLLRALAQVSLVHPDPVIMKQVEALGTLIVKSCSPDGYLQGALENEFAATPLRHIAQTLYGLARAGALVRHRSWLLTAEAGARSLFDAARQNGVPAGRYAAKWEPEQGYRCYSGMALTARLWMHAYRMGAPREYLAGAGQVLDTIAASVDCLNTDLGIRGGVRSGDPLWKNCQPMSYTTYAAKMAVDAMMEYRTLADASYPFGRLNLKRSPESVSGHAQGGERVHGQQRLNLPAE